MGEQFALEDAEPSCYTSRNIHKATSTIFASISSFIHQLCY